MIGRLALAGLLALTVSACERDNPKLFNIRKADRTPDEFSILPTRPLETPPDLAVLPTPTPGGGNRSDRLPEAEAIAALGGNPNGGSAADRALIGTAGRYGVDPAIRGQLAAEDLDFRRANDGRLLERVFNVNVYFKAYESQSLDQYAELYRLRRAGVRTVAAPPDPATVQ
ncbi:Beta-barrel assembly machine subunit BamF [Jannaschia helgolandensis]|uniref:Beta-barrel assembly machine subunit BamF n=2 Tax=Jannaschia helgolandensis TaxID=188906 RepID=A0A1H7IUF6_9RHOB|nr:Beta-barrel assembly machine subunit BamF [Jannaschia helgolandensis]|tara:strand:- start:77 stop:589 length:513 start_codon:yes stop_codon:yes gene_type:complete